MTRAEQAIYNRGRMAGIATVMQRARQEQLNLDSPSLTEILMEEAQKIHDDTTSILEAELADNAAMPSGEHVL